MKYTLTLYTRATSSHVQRLALLLVREPITRSDTPPMLCRSDRKLSRGVEVGLHPESIGQARVSDRNAGDRPHPHAQPRRDRQTSGERDRWTVTAGPSGAGFGTALRRRRALSASYSRCLSSAAHASATGGAESGVWAAPAEGEGAAGRHQLDAALSGRSAPVCAPLYCRLGRPLHLPGVHLASRSGPTARQPAGRRWARRARPSRLEGGTEPLSVRGIVGVLVGGGRRGAPRSGAASGGRQQGALGLDRQHRRHVRFGALVGASAVMSCGDGSSRAGLLCGRTDAMATVVSE